MSCHWVCFVKGLVVTQKQFADSEEGLSCVVSALRSTNFVLIFGNLVFGHKQKQSANAVVGNMQITQTCCAGLYSNHCDLKG
jgi:hypothetical protein